MASDMFLYWGSGSPPCWRAMLALEEKGFSDYPNKILSFDKQEHKSEEVMKWNPRGQLPTFVYKNHAVNESSAICDFVENMFASQGTRLLPNDPVELGLVLQRKYEVQNLETKAREVIMYNMRTKPEDFKQDEASKKIADFYVELAIWEGYLSKAAASDSGPVFIAGKQLTMADILLFPYLAFAVRFGMNFEPKYPNVSRYYKMMLDRPSVKKTWPPHWVGTEAPKKFFVAA